jgi:hypothetical protein
LIPTHIKQLEMSSARGQFQVGYPALYLKACTIKVLCNFKTIKTVQFGVLLSVCIWLTSFLLCTLNLAIGSVDWEQPC